ncbi:MAG: IS1182 family transposase [Bacteroidetes bacterium]|nr:MAG: IS1182 family transposase [Bacteroidota bacterium]
MAYKYGDRSQITFLPDCVDNYVGADDPVRAYDTFIDALKPQSIGLQIDPNAVGPPPYDPIVMVKILVYSYSYGWRGSRKIERALHHNLSFIWLAGGLKPDFKTISKFRKDNKEVFKKTLKQCARICFTLGLIEGNTLFVDGSKFRANAGTNQTKNKQSWEKIRKGVEQQIDIILDECERIDNEETESLVKVKKELKSQTRLKAKIDTILKALNEEEKINGTDPDSKIMNSRQGSHAGYNGQIVVDEKNGLIVSMDITSDANDLNQMEKQITQAEEILAKPCQNACADAGYSSVDDLKLLVDKDRTVVVPTPKQVAKDGKENRFDKHAFSYDATSDTYTCPVGKQMYRSYEKKEKNLIVYRMTEPSACGLCQHFGECTKAKRGRTISRLKNEETKECLEQIYDSDQGQLIYAKRKMKAELPFGHLKRNLGAGQFLLRGFEGVKAEFAILGSSFNIARMLTLLGGVRPLREAFIAKGLIRS